MFGMPRMRPIDLRYLPRSPERLRRPKRGGRLTTAVIFVGALSASLMSAASATPMDAGLQAIRADLNKDELTDLHLMADQDDISLDEAISSFGWHDSFAELANELEDRYPDEYAGAQITDSPGRKGWIGFKGDVPVQAESKIKAFSKAQIQAKGNKGFSVRELEETTMASFKAVSSQKDEIRSATSSYDLVTGGALIEVEPLDAATLEDSVQSADLRRKLIDSIPTSVRMKGLDVQLRADLKAETSVGQAFGGGCVLDPGSTCPGSAGTAPRCTGGFSVRNEAGDRRMMNAGHCPQTDLNWQNSPSGDVFSINNGPEHMGDWGDLQYFNVYDSAEIDDFYNDWNSIRDVQETRNAVEGTRVCRFGRRTGASCSTVEDTSVCVDYDRYPPMCRLTRTDSSTDLPGDSGGPWYYGNVAYGIHSGHMSHFGTNSLFTPVRLSEEALSGAYVITQ